MDKQVIVIDLTNDDDKRSDKRFDTKNTRLPLPPLRDAKYEWENLSFNMDLFDNIQDFEEEKDSIATVELPDDISILTLDLEQQSMAKAIDQEDNATDEAMETAEEHSIIDLTK